MIHDHDSQYKELFSNPTLVSELLRSFVAEDFVKHLDFSTLKKLNAHFVTGKFKKREADIIYQIHFKGKPVYKNGFENTKINGGIRYVRNSVERVWKKNCCEK